MKNRLKRPLVFLLILVFIIGPLSAVGARADQTEDPKAVYERKLQDAKDKKAALEKQKKESEKLIQEFKNEKENLEQYIMELDLQMNDISLALFETQGEIKNTEEELEVTKLAVEEAKAREKEQYSIMLQRVKYVYENGEPSIMDVLMSSAGISELLNSMEYISRIQEYDNSLLDRYEQAKQDVIDKQALLEATLEQLNVMREQEELDKATVEELIELKAAEIESFAEKIGINEEMLMTYISEISNQEMEIEEIIAEEEKRVAEEERKRKEEEERLAREAALKKQQQEQKTGDISKPASTAGYDADAINHITLTDETDLDKMIWPLPGDHRTYSKFGYRKAPIPGASTYHQGWDIGGEFGAPMVSVLAGKVSVVGCNSSAGNYVKVEHQTGFVSVYCHCSKILVSSGQYVQQGETIALVGSTGTSTAPHLHFAIQVNGTYVDPNTYIGKLE